VPVAQIRRDSERPGKPPIAHRAQPITSVAETNAEPTPRGSHARPRRSQWLKSTPTPYKRHRQRTAR